MWRVQTMIKAMSGNAVTVTWEAASCRSVRGRGNARQLRCVRVCAACVGRAPLKQHVGVCVRELRQSASVLGVGMRLRGDALNVILMPVGEMRGWADGRAAQRSAHSVPGACCAALATQCDAATHLAGFVW